MLGFPSYAPAVYELYWSPAHILARSHPNLLKTQRHLMSLWHSSSPTARISTAHPLCYADRLRIRQPGDVGFALGPHIDGGSVERWEPEGYGLGGVYDKIFEGKWEEYDPWEASPRIPVVSDLYNGAGACSMFRMFQGWLSMSTTGPGEGTLLVYPALKLATAYLLLRPFFENRHEFSYGDHRSDWLDASNWPLQKEITSVLQGAQLGNAQELNEGLHPHLRLESTMVHIPKIYPGDYVAWHCDSESQSISLQSIMSALTHLLAIHAVDAIHQGESDSSVLYIPVCPVTESNAQYLAIQRYAFRGGFPGPDFPGGEGESGHVGRPSEESLRSHAGKEGLVAMGLEKMDEGVLTERLGDREAVTRANEILGF